jgi:hypothetical protein
MLKAWHVHANRLWLRKEFLPTWSKPNTDTGGELSGMARTL